ncbi:hypothetical protein LNP18_10020, partial [Leuconostoc citreum]|uniref:hypothetical protein n=1 Tax=Leuconostoc citreum TaxID=33964 RepID=UPI00200B1C1C
PIDAAHQPGFGFSTRVKRIYAEKSVLPDTGSKSDNKSTISVIAITGMMISRFFLTKKSKNKKMNSK